MHATLSVSGRAPLRKSAADPADPAKKSTRRILYQKHAY